jgi:hypothetical protein
MIFHAAMALDTSKQLPMFAAGQDLMPPSLGLCNEETAQAPAANKRRATAAKK